MLKNALLIAPWLVFMVPATGCSYIHDTRSSTVVEVDPGEDGELLEGVTTLDHALWTIILESYASSDGVAYSELIEHGEDRYILQAYLDLLGSVEVAIGGGHNLALGGQAHDLTSPTPAADVPYADSVVGARLVGGGQHVARYECWAGQAGGGQPGGLTQETPSRGVGLGH